MRILQVIPYFLPDAQYGGPIEVVLGLSKALRLKGHQVTVMTTFPAGVSEARQQTITIGEVEICYCKSLRLERAFSYLPYIGQGIGFFYSPELKRLLEQRKQEFDLFHLHEIFCYPALVAGEQATISDIPYVLHLHSMLDPDKFARRGLKKRLYMKLFGKRLLNAASGIVALTEVEKENLRSLAPLPPVAVIPNGTDVYSNGRVFGELSQSKGEFGDSKVVLFLGRLHSVKGLDLLIAAFEKVSGGDPRALLVIAGPDELGLKEKLLRQAADSGLYERVRFVDMVAGEEKKRLIQRADVFALTSYSEGFSMAILEALSYGKPVVITDKCYFDDVARFEAGFVSPCEVEPIAENLKTLLQDSVLRKRMGENGRRLIEKKYTWDIVADKTVQFYEDVVKRAC